MKIYNLIDEAVLFFKKVNRNRYKICLIIYRNEISIHGR